MKTSLLILEEFVKSFYNKLKKKEDERIFSIFEKDVATFYKYLQNSMFFQGEREKSQGTN